MFYDDRNERHGVKFTDTNYLLIGIPHRLVMGEKKKRDSGTIEYKEAAVTVNLKILLIAI